MYDTLYFSFIISQIEAYESLAKGDGSDVSFAQVLQLGKSFKGDELSGAFKIGQRYVLFTVQYCSSNMY